MRDDASPEGRLLALIRKARPKKAEDKGADLSAEDKKRERKPFNISLLLKLFSGPNILKHLNKYLVFIIVVLALSLTTDILITKPRKTIVSLLTKIAETPSGTDYRKEDPIVPVKDFSQYSGTIASKKIFGLPPAQDPRGQDTGRPAEEIFGNLNLVGIIAGAEPQAIIEDKKSQKTYYLNKGQSFDGITVEDISEDKVKLESQGKQTTLVL